jgi:predicted transcriptional regulator
MRIVWDRPGLAVRDVVPLLPGRRLRAYTTVMTVMNRLFEKGLLEREAEGRAYVYRPRVTEAQFTESVSRSLIRSLLDEFGEVAVAHFVGEVREGGPESVRRLRELIAEE